MAIRLNFDFKIGVTDFQEIFNRKTEEKDLLLTLRRVYKNNKLSKEVYLISLEGPSKKNFLKFLGLESFDEDFK